MTPVKNDNLIQFRAAPGEHNIHGPTVDELGCRVGPDSSGVPSMAKVASLSLRRFFNLLDAALAQAGIELDGPEIDALMDLQRKRHPIVSVGTSNPEFLALLLPALLDQEPEFELLQPLADKMQDNLALTYAVHDAVERRLYASVRPATVRLRECGCPVDTDYRTVGRWVGDTDQITVCANCGEQIEL